MALNYISAAEAASLIKHGYNIGLSGFTPAGTAKAVTAEKAKLIVTRDGTVLDRKEYAQFVPKLQK